MASDNWYFNRTGLALTYLNQFERLGARALTVFAERAVGKTAFLINDLAPQASSMGRVPVYLDVWSVRNDPAVGIADSLKSIVQEFESRKALQNEVTGFNFSLLGAAGGVSLAQRIQPGEPSNVYSRINFWADRLAHTAGERKVLFMMDEVQQLTVHPDGVNVAASIRAAFQRNFHSYEPVFTGSSRDQLLMMFKSSKAPLFNYGDDIQFPKLDIAFSRFIAGKTEKAAGIELDPEQVDQAFEVLGRKPGDLIGMVRHMVNSGERDLTAALAHSISQERKLHERDLALAKLSPLDQAVLLHVAHGKAVFSQESLINYASSLKVRSISVGAIQKSLDRLRDEQLVFSPERGKYSLNDAGLAAMLRETIPQPNGPSALPAKGMLSSDRGR